MIISLGCMIGAQICAMEDPLSSEEQMMNTNKKVVFDIITRALVQIEKVKHKDAKSHYEELLQQKNDMLAQLSEQQQKEL